MPRGGSRTSFNLSNQLIKQTSPSLEEVIIKQVRRSVASVIDNAVFNGTGAANNQPSGILNWGESSFGSSDYSKRSAGVTFGTTNVPKWSEVLTLPYNVSANNVEPDDTCAFVTSPLGKYRLFNTPRVTGYPGMIWGDDNTIAGKRAFDTNNISTSQLVYGKFSELLICIYAILIESDIYSLASHFQTVVRCHVLADVGPLHGTAFAVSSNSLT